MKRILALLVAVVLCVFCAACDKKPVQSQIENFEDKSNVELAIESVNGLLSSQVYEKKNGEFEELTGSASRTPKVTYVMEYKNDNMDGFAVHLLLISLEVDFAANNAFYDRTTLVIDLENGSWCDEIRSDFEKWQKSFSGICKSKDDCYFLFLQPTFVDAGQSGSVLWSDAESYSVLTEDELVQINAGLQVK